MTKPRNANTLPPVAQWLILALLVLGLLGLGGWGLHNLFNSHGQVAIWDFHPRWWGLRAMLLEGSNPYGEQVTLGIQRQMYERAALPEEDQIAFAYPLHVMAIIGPLALLPLPLAQTIWYLLLVVSLLAFALIAPRAVGWHPPTWLLALTVLFVVGMYPNVWALILGQVSVFVAALIALVWWGLRSERWVLSGICLALVTVKPQMAFLLVPVVMLWALWRRNWRLLGSFAAVLGLLVLLPLPWLIDWPLEWLRAVGRYAGYTPFDPPLKLILGYGWLAWAAAGLLLAWTAYAWWHSRREDRLDNWTLSMLVVISALIAPRTSQANQLVLLLPLFFLFSRLPRSWMVVLVELLLLVGLWLIDILILPPVASAQHVIWQHRIISPLLPLGLIAALLIISPRQSRPEAGTAPEVGR